MDPLQWMGAVRMRVQTADKNITIIHTTLVHQLISCEAKSYVFKLFSLGNSAWSVHFSHLIQTRDFSLEKAVLWIKYRYILAKSNDLKLKNVILMDLFITNMQLLTSQDINWWTGVVWIMMFLSTVWTLILMAPIHCRGSIGEQVM